MWAEGAFRAAQEPGARQGGGESKLLLLAPLTTMACKQPHGLNLDALHIIILLSEERI